MKQIEDLSGLDLDTRLPRSTTEENAASDGGMDVGVPSKRRPEGLNDGHHAGARVGLVDGGRHHLVDGFVGESCQLSQKRSMIQKVGSKHFG